MNNLDCKELNSGTNYCQKKKMYVTPDICKDCIDYSKPSGINENLQVLVD